MGKKEGAAEVESDSAEEEGANDNTKEEQGKTREELWGREMQKTTQNLRQKNCKSIMYWGMFSAAFLEAKSRTYIYTILALMDDVQQIWDLLSTQYLVPNHVIVYNDVVRLCFIQFITKSLLLFFYKAFYKLLHLFKTLDYLD